MNEHIAIERLHRLYRIGDCSGLRKRPDAPAGSEFRARNHDCLHVRGSWLCRSLALGTIGHRLQRRAAINKASKSAPGFLAAAWAAASAAASLRAPSCTNASVTSAATAETSPLFGADALRASRRQEGVASQAPSRRHRRRRRTETEHSRGAPS